MDRLKALSIFQTVARKGSFSHAAAELDISRTAVTRSVQELEAMLAVRLFQRTTRKVTLTSAGEQVLAHATEVLDRFDIISGFAKEGHAPAGKVRLSAPAWLGHKVIGAALAAYVVLHPRISLDLQLQGDTADVVGPAPDLRLCLAHDLRPDMIARTVGLASVGCYASPEYLNRRGEPATPMLLRDHDVLTFPISRSNAAWQFVDIATGNACVQPVRAVVSANQLDTLAVLTAQGVGIALLPDFLTEDMIGAGTLRRILPGWRAEPMAFYIAYTSRLHQQAGVRHLIEHLGRAFAELTGRDYAPACNSSMDPRGVELTE